MPRGYPNQPNQPRIAANGKRVTPTIASSEQYGAIVWALQTWGDINEGYKGGNAAATLLDRISTAGYVITEKDFTNRLRYLVTLGVVSIIRSGKTGKGGAALNIRLVAPPQPMPPNPFLGLIGDTDLADAVAVVEDSGSHVVLNGYRKLSLSDRMALLGEIAEAEALVRASIMDDLQKPVGSVVS